GSPRQLVAASLLFLVIDPLAAILAAAWPLFGPFQACSGTYALITPCSCRSKSSPGFRRGEMAEPFRLQLPSPKLLANCELHLTRGLRSTRNSPEQSGGQWLGMWRRRLAERA